MNVAPQAAPTRPGRSWTLTASLVALLVFGVLLTVVAEHLGPFALDRSLLAGLGRHRGHGVTGLARVVSTVAAPAGVQILVAAVVLAVTVRCRSWWPVLLGLVSMGGAQVASTGVKRLVGRPRPSVADRVAHVSAHGLSFPSGHATAAAAGFTVIAVLLAPVVSARVGRGCLFVLAAALIVLVGWSRVYLGVHWPTDVVGGWLLGLGWTLGCVAGFDRARARRRTGPRPCAGLPVAGGPRGQGRRPYSDPQRPRSTVARQDEAISL